MSSEFDHSLAAARVAYLDALDGESGEQRLRAARDFRLLSARFAEGGTPALEALERAALDAEPWRATVAVRIYSGLEDPATAARFIAFVMRVTATGIGHIDATHLRRLGSGTPAPFEIMARVESVHRAFLIFPMFRYQSDAARALFETLLADPDYFCVTEAMNGLARWNERDLLQRVLLSPPLQAPADLESPVEGVPNALSPKDVRPHAAFLLALLGDAAGLDSLLAFASGSSGDVARAAVQRLAWLAHSSGVAPATAMLRSRTNVAIQAAMDAAGDYRAAAFVPALLDLIKRKLKTKHTIPDDAINILASEIGRVALPDAIASLMGVAGHHVGEGGRRKALELLREATLQLDPSLRYWRGEPLTLAHLTDALLSRHAGTRAVGAYQLRALTGEDHGYDVDDDIIANVPAIDAWRARLAQPDPFAPGHWAFLGKPLAPPAVP